MMLAVAAWEDSWQFEAIHLFFYFFLSVIFFCPLDLRIPPKSLSRARPSAAIVDFPPAGGRPDATPTSVVEL